MGSMVSLSGFGLLIIGVLAAALALALYLKAQAENRYALLIDSMNAQAYGLILFDKNGRMIQANAQARAYVPLLSAGDGGALNMRAFLNYMYDHAVDYDRDLGSAIDKTVENTLRSFREVISWGDEGLCMVTAQKSSRGGFVFILTDITDLKEREADLYQTQKLEALGKMAAGVAHDFNNVLSIIDGYARMAADEIGSEGQVVTYINRIQSAAQRGASLTKRMLTFSRHKIVAAQVTDFYQVVRDQESLLRPLVGSAVELCFAPPPEKAYVECMPDTVGQILMNLVVNARDAMPDGGQILIGVDVVAAGDLPSMIKAPEGAEDLVVLSVSDSGVGMDRETVRKIFDPFFTTKEQGKGTGLGLSMVYGMVREMGGTIDAQSMPGEGTTLSIYLPRSRKKPESHERGKESGKAPAGLDGYTILVAEDEPELLKLVSSMLEKQGANVLTAANGNEALNVQKEHDGPIDVLLTDVVMPELSGIELASLFSTMRENTKVIFMSGYPANDKMARAELPMGATFMAKPIVFEELSTLIHKKLQSKTAQPPDDKTARWRTQS